MPTAFRALGPIEHWVRPFGSSQFLYLGTAVTSPSLREGDAFLPIMNDIGGRSVETQTVRDRRKSVIVTTLNRFNWVTYSTIKGMAGLNFNETYASHGVPVLGVSDLDLLMVFSFGPAFSAVDTPNGRLYFGTVLKDWEENSVGSRVVELTLHFESFGRLDPTTRTFAKYTEDASVWGALTPE